MPFKITSVILLIVALCACTKSHFYNSKNNLQRLSAIENKQNMPAATQPGLEENNLQAQESRLFNIGNKIKNSGISICAKMEKISGGCDFEFKLANGGEQNAYDSNKIYITLAMLNFLEKDDDLAIILGHEYAHNILGHIKSNKKNNRTKQIIFSTKIEKDADYVGLYITTAAGYNTTQAPDLWRKISTNNSLPLYINMIHQSNPERYLGLEKNLAEINRKKHNGAMLIPSIR